MYKWQVCRNAISFKLHVAENLNASVTRYFKSER